jgi:hypothetical protein
VLIPSFILSALDMVVILFAAQQEEWPTNKNFRSQ